MFPSVNQRLIADVEFQRAGPLSALEPAAFAAGSVVGRAPLARPRRHQQHYPHADRADDRAANHESKQRLYGLGQLSQLNSETRQPIVTGA